MDDSKDDIDGATENSEATENNLSKAELRRRKRTVRASKALFRAIDILLSQTHNACPYVTKQNAGSIECIDNIVYDESDPSVCIFDMYRVNSESKNPAVILIHGGGFSAGGKQYRKGQSGFLALNGFTVFCVDYGLAPDYVFPKPIAQLAKASEFIYEHADEYNINKNKIIIMGDSAGAYYSAMLAAIGTDRNLSEKLGIKMRFMPIGTILNCGLYDIDTVFKTRYLLDLDDGVFLSFTGLEKKKFDSFEYKDYCMPSAFVSKDFPPSFLVFSPHDLFCRGQGEAMVKKMNDAGAYCEYYSAQHSTSNHCFSLNWRGEDPTAANLLMLSFAKRLVTGHIKL